MRKLLWIENAVPINSRSARLLQAAQRTGEFEVVVCAWNRTGAACPEERDPSYRILKSATGEKRLLRKALDLPRFIDFVSDVAQSEKPDLVVASFWDATLAAAWAVRKSHVPIVYDVLDMPGGGRMLYTIGRALEALALPRVTATLLASRFYDRFYSSRVSQRLVVENRPDLGAELPSESAASRTANIAYVGSVRFPETLVPLLSESLSRGQRVDVHGGGPDLPSLKASFGANPLVTFHGSYAYGDLPGIYQQVGIVWAAYPAYDINVRHAISNKYFESLWFGVPAVFSEGTDLGEMVQREGTGFVVDAMSPKSVGRLLDALSADETLFTRVREQLLQKRARLRNELSWRSQEEGVVELFRRVCAIR